GVTGREGGPPVGREPAASSALAASPIKVSQPRAAVDRRRAASNRATLFGPTVLIAVRRRAAGRATAVARALRRPTSAGSWTARAWLVGFDERQSPRGRSLDRADQRVAASCGNGEYKHRQPQVTPHR